MKHYICVEEHKITYICGTYRAPGHAENRGTIVIQDVRSVPVGTNIQNLFIGLAQAHNLAGRKIDLVLGRDLSYMKVKLPKSGDRALRLMACNQLIAGGKCGADGLAAVDIQREPGERQIPAMVYYVEKDKLDLYRAAMEQAGIIHGETLLMPDCTAKAFQMLCRSRFNIVINVEKEGLSLYAVSCGHCLAWRSMPLKVDRFCEQKAEVLLYEEVAEQAQHILTQVMADGNASVPEGIVLEGNSIPNVERAAAFMEKYLKLPCSVANFNVSVEPDTRAGHSKADVFVDTAFVSPGGLAAVVAGGRCTRKSLRLKSLQDGEGTGPFKWLSRIVSRSCALFLLVNVVIAGGVFGYMETVSRQTHQKMLNLRDTMNAPEYIERYRSIQKLDSQMVEEIKRKHGAEEAREAAASYLKREDFEAFTDALEPGMKVEAVIYERGDGPYLELMVSQSNASLVPSYVGRLRASDIFQDVRHTLWEKRESGDGSRVHATVRGDLKKGGQNEIQ